MRKSLSETTTRTQHVTRRAPLRGTALAVVGGLVLAVAAAADQLGGRSLVDRATQLYAAYDTEVSSALLYGALYVAAGVNTLLWLVVLARARIRCRWAPLMAAAACAVGLALAGSLLGAREYGEAVFPPVWGVLALLSPAAGVLAVTQLARTREAR